MEDQKYCISARTRQSGVTLAITDGMSKENADAWQPNKHQKAYYTYFRVSKHPFKTHKKNR